MMVRKRFSYLFLFLVLIFCHNLCIIISKSSFFYVIYAKDGRKKTYLCDKTYFIPIDLIGT
jgi:hypothetical protein